MLHAPCSFRFSTIIVNWNTRDYLLQCVGSLLRYGQPGENQIIVVDNASADDSVEALRRQFPEVEIIASKENLGFAKGNNVGIRQAKGRYVCLVNSDIEVFDDVLGKMGAYMDTHPEIGVLASRLLTRGKSIQQGCWNFPTPLRYAAYSLGLSHLLPGIRTLSIQPNLEGNQPRTVDTACGAFWMIRREALEQVGLLDEAFWFYGEDVDYCRRFRDAGWQIVYYPEAQVVHYGGASSSKAPIKYQVQMTRAKLQIWRKYYRFPVYQFLWGVKAFHHTLRAVAYSIKSILSGQNEQAQHKLKTNWACLCWMFTGKVPQWSDVSGQRTENGP